MNFIWVIAIEGKNSSQTMIIRLYIEEMNIPVIKNEMISEIEAAFIENIGIKEVKVRSVLGCHAKFGVCAHCYGIKYPLSPPYIIENTAAAKLGKVTRNFWLAIAERFHQLTDTKFALHKDK